MSSVAVAAAPSPAIRAAASVRRGDTGWLIGIAAAVAILCGLPYVLAAALGPPDLDRLGTFWFGKDFSQYAAAMREGARQSGWLIHDHFSVEPHTAALMYPLYVAAGKLAAALELSNVTVFATLEWLGRLAVLGAVYVFAAAFVEGRRQRRDPLPGGPEGESLDRARSAGWASL